MSLTTGTGPFSAKRRGVFNSRIEGPAHLLYFESYERRMRAIKDGETVIDTTGGMLLYESNIHPVLYVPEQDVGQDLLTPSDHTTHCPFKGDASYRNVGSAENAIWFYPEPIETASFLRGYMAAYWHLMDAWFEEDERLEVRFRDPYHRVDVRESSARVTVRANGEVVASSDRPLLLFETGLPVRAYLRREEVRADLVPTDKSTVCPYKGTASYWSIGELEDVVWSYRDPIPEAKRIEGLMSFLGDGVEVEIGRDYADSTSDAISRAA
jgi:uncharacterized protein (DUF427 family)